VFENRVLRRIFGLKRNEVAGGWRKMHNDELQNLYASPNLIRVVKGDEMGGAQKTHGDMRNDTKCWLGNLKGRGHSEYLGNDEKIILEWILGKYSGKVRTACIWFRMGPMAGSCKHRNKPLGSTKCREFLDKLSSY
jgi:hypothetical protein